MMRANIAPLASLALLAGCASTPEPPLKGPEVAARVGYYAGDPIGGPEPEERALALEVDPADSLELRLEVFLLTSPPAGELELLERHLRMIVAGDGTQPLAPSSLLTPGTGLATGPVAERMAEEARTRGEREASLEAELEGLCLPGMTTEFSLAHVQAIELSGYRPSERRVDLEVWREAADSPLSIAVTMSDVVETLEDLAVEAPRITRHPREELLVLDALLEPPSGTLVIYAGARFDPEQRLGYLLVLTLDEPREDAAGLEERVAAAVADAQEIASLGTDRRRRLLADEELRLRHLHAIDALADPSHRRGALLDLAGAAPIAAELTLLADAAIVEAYASGVASRSDELQACAGQSSAMSWLLERAALALLSKELIEGELASEYVGMVLRHTGEAGRYPSILEEFLEDADDLEEFYLQVFDENRFALEGPNPAARVRAYDWLRAQGIPIEGYDPLAGRAERRAALEAWALQEASAEGIE